MITLPPFKSFLASNIPSVYDNTLSYYDELTKLIAYLEQQVVPAVNKNSEDIQKYVDGLEQLKEYVDHYFDNLDVQTEINNKLDEMAEDGTLAEIINEQVFEQLNTKIDNNKADILAEIADTRNPIHYGADPTGVEDSTQAINDCIDANKGGSVDFTTGVYLISGPIILPFEQDDKVSINGNGSKIVTSSTIDEVFFVGGDRTNPTDMNDAGYPCYIKDFFVDCSDGTVTYGIMNANGFKDLRIENCTFYRVVNGIKINENLGTPSDVLVSNSLFYGKGSEHAGVGIICNGSDNYIDETRIYGFRTGIEMNSYMTLTNVQVLLRWENQTATNFDPYERNSALFNQYYEQTSFCEVGTTGAARFLNCYADSTYFFANIGDTSGQLTFDGCLYSNARNNVKCSLFECLSDHPKLNFTNCVWNLTSGSSVSMLKNVSSDGLFKEFSQIHISGIEINGIGGLTNYVDPMLTSFSEYDMRRSVTLTDSAWVVVKAFTNVTDYTNIDTSVYINGWKYDCKIENSDSNANATVSSFNTSDTQTNYVLGLARDGHTTYLCAKIASGQSSTTVSLDAVKNYAVGFVFDVNTVYQNSMRDSSRLLSNFTNVTPAKTLRLCSANNIKTAS